MTALPGFVFSAFESTADKQFAGWAAFRDAVNSATRLDGETSPVRPPARGQQPGASPLGIWRLLASNNRELGRSGSAYSSFEAAREHVLRLQRSVDDLVVVGVRGAASSQYGWLALLGDAPVITSGRWFGASSTSMHSAATTLAAFETATVSDEVWVGSHSAGRGARRGLVAASTW